MKKSILVVAATILITSTILTSCNTPAQKVEDAQENVNEANEDLDEANKEYLADVANYRKEVAEKIAANNKSMAEFKAKIARENKDAKVDYNSRMVELEQKNTNMKMKMDNYKMDAKDNWETFKSEFNRDMDELGKSFNDLTVKNIK